MKVLAISDIHKNKYALKKILRLIEEHSPDLLLITGDITTFGPLEFAFEFLDGLPDLRTLVLPGNCDPPEILEVFDSSRAENLHGRKVTISDVPFVGLGGSNSTPFNTPFELTEEEIFEKLDPIMEPGAILALHFPVKGHLDLVPRGIETGSTGALKIVEKFRPSLVISGHIHETRGSETDGYGTKYVNPGQMQRGYYAIIDIVSKDKIDNTELRYDCEIQLLE